MYISIRTIFILNDYIYMFCLDININNKKPSRAYFYRDHWEFYIKRCQKCKFWKLGNYYNFYRDLSRSDSLFVTCVDCISTKYINLNGPIKRYGGRGNKTPIGFKRCSKCRIILLANPTNFYVNKNDKSGFNHRCKCCIKAHKKSNPSIYRNYDKNWRDKNPDKILLKYKHCRVEFLSAAQKEAKRQARLKNNLKRLKAEDKIIKDYNIKDIFNLLKEQSYKCLWCGINIKEQYSVDHFIPLAKGGLDCIDNIVLSCRHCNFSKRDKLPWYFNAKNLTDYGIYKISKYVPMVINNV